MSSRNRKWCVAARVAVLCAACVAGTSAAWKSDAAPSTATPRWDATLFLPGGTYDPAIPTPEAVLGFPMGTRPVRYEEMLRYLAAIDAASSRIAVQPYAKSHEGRALIYAAIGTEARVADLEAVRAAAARWADPDSPLPAEPPAGQPLVAWLGYAIHGDELSSTDAALQVIYQLVAGTDSVTARIRERVLVCIDPAQNPDGRERFLAQMQAFAGRVPNPDDQSLQHQGMWPWGRANHYLFDLNRDWIYVVNPESRGRVRALTSWNPQLVVDSHEMGWDDTYLFSPAREPFNPHLPALMRPWVYTFSRDQAAAFDRRGWSYYTREWNEEFFPGYGSSWAAYHGAVGILYEQAGTDGSLVRQSDGSLLTFRDAVQRQFTSSITNLDTASRNDRALLRDSRLSRRASRDAGRRGPVRAFAYSGADSSRAAHLTQVLLLQDIEVLRARGPITVANACDAWGARFGSKRLPRGSFVVPLDQPLGDLVRNLLEFHVAMPDSFLREERTWLERGKGTRLYEDTAWSLLLGHGLESYWTGSLPQGDLELVTDLVPTSGRVENPRPAAAYVIDGRGDETMQAVARLLERGAGVRIALEPFDVSGRHFARGSALLRLQSGADSVHAWAADVARETGVVVHGLDSGKGGAGPDLGGNRFESLVPPRIALVCGEAVGAASYGTLWHLLDHDLQLRVSSLPAASLRFADLSKYNVLVLPRGGWGGGGYARTLGPDGVTALREWVEAGGTLVGIGEGAALLADSARALSKVRLRHQALKEFASPSAREMLPEIGIRTAIGDEPRAAFVPGMPILGPGALRLVQAVKPRGVQYALSLPLEPKPAAGKESASRAQRAGSGASGDADGGRKGSDMKELERADERLRELQPRGAFLRADLDGESWLTAGLPARLPVLVDTDVALIARPPVQVAGRFASADSLHLSGLLWPEGAERVARTAYLTRERRGKGQVILFAADPTFRRALRATERLFLNAVLLGPGLGTERSAPW